MSDRFVTRGFVGRGEAGGEDLASRTPPGRYMTSDFPVLSAGPTRRTPLDRWSLSIEGFVAASATWTWNCYGVVLRIVETAKATYLDARGAAYLRFERRVERD